MLGMTRFTFLKNELSPNLMNLSRVTNPPNPVSIKRRIKSWNIEHEFKEFNWNQQYLSRVSNLSRKILQIRTVIVCFSLTTWKNWKINYRFWKGYIFDFKKRSRIFQFVNNSTLLWSSLTTTRHWRSLTTTLWTYMN